ncbi:MAG: cysteine-rich CWC family protein [Bacteroidales bacterium]
MSQKICPKCKQPFDCEGDSDCWCENIQLTPVAYKQLLMEADDCICPRCMKSYTQRPYTL